MMRKDGKRESKDKCLNNRAKELIDLVGDIESYFLNATTRREEDGEYLCRAKW